MLIRCHVWLSFFIRMLLCSFQWHTCFPTSINHPPNSCTKKGRDQEKKEEEKALAVVETFSKRWGPRSPRISINPTNEVTA